MSIITELNAIRRRNKTAHNLHQQTSYTIPLGNESEYIVELGRHIASTRKQAFDVALLEEVMDSVKNGSCEVMGISIHFDANYLKPASPDERMDLIARNGNNGEHYDEASSTARAKVMAVLRRDPGAIKQLLESTPTCVLALQAVVEANDRYVELTGRSQDAIVLHPDHARELLELLSKKV